MGKTRTTVLSLMIMAAIIAMSFTSVYAEGPAGAPAGIEGAYQAVLILPKAKPTAILTFCPGGEPFKGAWLEDGGKKFVNIMTNQKVSGREMSFRVQAGPGIWDFVCTLDGDTLKGTVTGDGATSNFEGKKVTLEEEYCSKPGAGTEAAK